MFKEYKSLDKLLNLGRILVPKPIFRAVRPIYHWGLAMLGVVIYGFPSRTMTVIAVTGTKGKSTTVFMISKIFEEQGLSVAAIGSLGFKIKDRIWPNNLKMTLPGRLKLQKFLYQAKKAGVKYVVLEATSEGIAQHRLFGVNIDCAVYTNLHREHLESHGSFENYMMAKQKLFLKTRRTHVLNIDDLYFEKFANFPAKHKITYGRKRGDVFLENSNTPLSLERGEPSAEKFQIKNLCLKLLGGFNEYNALAALAVARAYDLNVDGAVKCLNSIESISGRMEILRSSKGFDVVIDYAHTPDSLGLVYQALRRRLTSNQQPVTSNQSVRKLICALGAAGGGRDKWKRPEFGKIAAKYCDEIILTNEDPYDENPEEILDQISSGFSKSQIPDTKFQKILDRREAIGRALVLAQTGDIVVITGKGSETSMAVAEGRKIPWSDKNIVKELLDLKVP